MIFLFVIVPILIAVFLYLFPHSRIARIIVIIAQAALVCCAFYLFTITRDSALVSSIGNFDSVLGIMLIADSLSSVFIVLTTFAFFIAAVYSYHEDNSGLFWFLLFIWEGLLLGILLAGDLFNIFVLVEVATVVVAVLIMFNRGKRSMYDGMVYLMVNVVVVQFYLFGIGYIYKLTGVLDISRAGEILQTLDKSQLVLPYALIITTIALKCAFMPLYSWLPRAHGSPGAPSSVSAILSGLHIKCGLYLFIRVQELFGPASQANFFLVIGIITGVAGFMMALSQTDIKKILAFSTISQVGLITIGLNVADTYTFTGSLYHIVNHSLFKMALFLSAGIIINIYGTRDINKIRGLFKKSPLIAVVTIMAIFGITGVPMFNGSISKYFIVSGTNWIVTAAIIFINLGTVTLFIRYSMILFGKPEGIPENIKIDEFQKAAVTILGALCFITGIFGEEFIQLLFNLTVSVDTADFLQKAGLFAGSLVCGFLIFKYYVPKSKFIGKIGNIDPGFRGICISIGLFFALILITSSYF